MNMVSLQDSPSVEVPQQMKTRTTTVSSNSTSEYIFEEHKNTNLERCMHLNVHSSFIYNSQDMEATQVSINRWKDKEDVIHTHTYTHTHTHIHTHTYIHTHTHTYEYHSAMNEILPLEITWLDLQDITLSEIS